MQEFTEWEEESFMVFEGGDIYLQVDVGDKVGNNNDEFTVS